MDLCDNNVIDSIINLISNGSKCIIITVRLYDD